MNRTSKYERKKERKKEREAQKRKRERNWHPGQLISQGSCKAGWHWWLAYRAAWPCGLIYLAKRGGNDQKKTSRKLKVARKIATGSAARPGGPFTMLLPQPQDIGEFYVVQKRRPTVFEPPKL